MKGRATRFLARCAAAIALWGVAWASDQVPAPVQSRPVALVGGTIHPVEAAPIPGGVLVFDRGRITALGPSASIPADAERIDLGPAERVYPGLIASSTQLGLIEISAVRATDDQSELGDLNPNVRAEASVNPDSELIPVARANGIALAVSQPEGGLISGSSALIRLDGWTCEDLVVKAPLGIHVNWPAMRVEVPGDSGETDRRRRERDRRIALIRDAFRHARAYGGAKAAAAKSGAAAPVDLRWEALLPVIEKNVPVFLHAEDERQIRAAVSWAAQEGLRAVLMGGVGAPRVASLLRENDVAVIYGPVYALPGRRHEPYDAPFSGPAALHRSGVRFAIADFHTYNVRNLPYHAATAAAFGLPAGEALKAITLYPAQILGVAERYGSLAAGKSATLMITDGDPLEITTHVKALWIDGRRVDLRSKHTALHEKYAEQLRRGERGRVRGY